MNINKTLKGATCEGVPASDCTLQSTWLELSFHMRTEHAIRSLLSSPSRCVPDNFAVAPAVKGAQAAGWGSRFFFLSARPAAPDRSRSDRLSIPTGSVLQDAGATPAAAEDDGSLSLSGSNRDESADGATAVNGFLRLFTVGQNSRNPGYFCRE